MLEIREAQPQHYPETRFDLETPGFNETWWQDDGVMGIDPGFKFFMDGEEVARAEVKLKEISGSYIGLNSPHPVLEITFFEVRKDLYRRGIGREAISLLVQAHPEHDMAAFANDEKFWHGIEWIKFHRTDGATSNRSLFMHWAAGTVK